MLHKEVMLGNILQDNNKLSFLQVDQIIETGFSCKVLDRSVYPLKRGWKAVGVEITEEIILSIGFDISYNGKYHKNYDLHVSYNGNNILSFCWDKSTGWHIKYCGEKYNHIKYLHQLQNLYFILTGEKLDVSNLLK